MTDRNKELDGKVAIVTGSARNIGRAIAEELARAGAAVTINAKSAGELCEEVAQGIRKAGGKAIACRADITEPAEVKKLVDATVEAFGGVDILINNAAIRTNIKFPELKFEDWVKLRAVALDGALLLSMACTPLMIKRGGGSIVGISGTVKLNDPNPKIPMGRRGTPQDMADLVRFLVGPYSRFITGQTIHVNGGALMPS